MTKEYIDHQVKDSVLKQTNTLFTSLIAQLAMFSLVTAIFFFISSSNKTELKEDIQANKAELKEDIQANKVELKEIKTDLVKIKTALKIQ